MEKPRNSNVQIYGFAGKQAIPADLTGTVHAFVLGIGNANGTPIQFSTDTVTSINHDLMSLTQWYQHEHYNLVLDHDGFSGLFKRDELGHMTDKIPVYYDSARKQWIFDMIIAADTETATRVGQSIQQALCGYTRMQPPLFDNTGNTIALLVDTQQHSSRSPFTFLTMRNGHETVYLDSSETGGVIQYGRDIGDNQFFDVEAFHSYYEDEYREPIGAFGTSNLKPTDATTAGVKAALPSREKKMSALEFHQTHGHIGHADGCDICLKLRKTLRRVYKTVDPYKDQRNGYAWSMDGITWSDQSKQGNKYTVVLRERGISGFIILLHLAYKSDATERIRQLKQSLGTDPRFGLTQRTHGYRLLSEIHTDPAGEWRDDNEQFQTMCKDNGINIIYSSPDDKRNASHAENAVGVVERGTKAIMMQTSCPVEYVEYAADQFVLLHNCFPKVQDLHSSDGDAPRPMETLTSGRISRRQCDKIIHHSIPVGTPCLVTIPHIKGSDITNIARCRWMIFIKQYGDLPVFECPYTGQHVRSKGYVRFNLAEGQNAWSFIGLTPPKLSKPQNRTSELMQHFIQLDIPTVTVAEKPVITSAETPLASRRPQVITVDRDGSVFVPDANGKLVPTDEKIPSLARPDQSTLHDVGPTTAQVETDLLTTDPDSFVGHHAYKYFEDTGVIHGIVTETDNDSDTASTIWIVTYDDGDTQPFDREDMLDYVINHKHGNRVLNLQDARHFLNVAPLDDTEIDAIMNTENNDTFIDICKKLGLPQNQWKSYYEWLRVHKNYGHQNDSDESGLKFRLPWGGDGKLKLASKQSKFDADTPFPVPTGKTWTDILDKHKVRSDTSNDVNISANISRYLTNHIYQEQRLRSKLDTVDSDGDAENFYRAVQREIEPPQANITIDVSAKATKLSPNLLQLVEHNDYIDNVTGKIIPPKTVNDAKRRTDWPLWKHAIDVELGSLEKLGVFSHDYTLADLRKKGVHQTPVPQKMVFDAKYDPEGRFVKPKARNCIAGHKGVMRYGEHFWGTFAAAPRTDTTRILQALAVGIGYHRSAFDISVAFCQADCREYEKIPLRYPPGMERRDADGNTLYALLERNLYGSPAAPRRWSETRNKWMTTTFNKNGWTCTKMRYDPCLFKFTTPDQDELFLLVHVDDCDIISKKKSDAALIMKAFDDKYGITICDPDFMLGIQRKQYSKNGVHYLEMTQPDYIDTMVKQFETEVRKARLTRTSGEVTTPVPPGTFLSTVGDPDHNEPPPDQEEVEEVLAMGYQNAVGSLNWASRHCYPETAAGLHLLCRVMAKPSRTAFKCAMHMIGYLDGQRDRGIRFRSNATGSPICYYDSSSKRDPKDSHAQYGWVIIMYGGPVMWSSKKHNHAGRSTTDDEYMAQAHACTAVLWIRSLLREMGFPDLVGAPTPMMGDNDQATNLAREDILTQANRYFRLEYHFAKECYESGDTQPLRVASIDNVSDLLTKALPAQTVARLRPGLTGYGSLTPPPAPPRD